MVEGKGKKGTTHYQLLNDIKIDKSYEKMKRAIDYRQTWKPDKPRPAFRQKNITQIVDRTE